MIEDQDLRMNDESHQNDDVRVTLADTTNTIDYT